MGSAQRALQWRGRACGGARATRRRWVCRAAHRLTRCAHAAAAVRVRWLRTSHLHRSFLPRARFRGLTADAQNFITMGVPTCGHHLHKLAFEADHTALHSQWQSWTADVTYQTLTCFCAQGNAARLLCWWCPPPPPARLVSEALARTLHLTC